MAFVDEKEYLYEHQKFVLEYYKKEFPELVYIIKYSMVIILCQLQLWIMRSDIMLI